jgi:hypothetical protein
MATAYPGALDATNNQLRTDISSTDDLDASGKEHDVMHVNAHGAVVELETKLGTGSSTASSGAVMMGTGSGTSAWDTSPTILGALTIGADGAGHDVTFHSDTAGDALVWDSSAESLTITGTNAQTALAVVPVIVRDSAEESQTRASPAVSEWKVTSCPAPSAPIVRAPRIVGEVSQADVPEPVPIITAPLEAVELPVPNLVSSSTTAP